MTKARHTRARSRNSSSPSITQPPMLGLVISWIPKAPLVRPRQFRKTLKAIMAKPKETRT